MTQVIHEVEYTFIIKNVLIFNGPVYEKVIGFNLKKEVVKQW